MNTTFTPQKVTFDDLDDAQFAKYDLWRDGYCTDPIVHDEEFGLYSFNIVDYIEE